MGEVRIIIGEADLQQGGVEGGRQGLLHTPAMQQMDVSRFSFAPLTVSGTW